MRALFISLVCCHVIIARFRELQYMSYFSAVFLKTKPKPPNFADLLHRHQTMIDRSQRASSALLLMRRAERSYHEIYLAVVAWEYELPAVLHMANQHILNKKYSQR